MSVKVRYVAPIFSASGYGEAARGYVTALLEAGVEVAVHPIGGEPHRAAYGPIDKELRRLCRRQLDWDMQILHSTPEWWPDLVDDRPAVGLSIWETTNVHPRWVGYVQRSGIQELWTPTQFSRDAFNRSLPGVPMVKVPHVVHPASLLEPSVEEVFVLYSVFQWTERKNPGALLRAYITEFTREDKVGLIVKTFRYSTAPDQQRWITDRLAKLVQDFKVPLDEHPRLKIVLDSLSFAQMQALHREGDCYVSPHRGEGWGLPITEGMAHGNPAIVTAWSGNMEYCTQDNSFLVPYTLAPVTAIARSPWYFARQGGVTQEWASIDEAALRVAMRTAYEDRGLVRSKGVAAKDSMAKYTPAKIGALMRGRIEEILGTP